MTLLCKRRKNQFISSMILKRSDMRLIHPFQVKSKEKVQTDWEHSEYKWIPTAYITQYQTVPHLQETVKQYLDDSKHMGK